MSKLDVRAAMAEANPVRRSAVEGAAGAVGGELVTAIVAEPREAGAAVAARRRLTGRRAARVLAAGFACLALGGTAMAATGVWDPGIGSEAADSPPVSVSSSPVSAGLTAVLGVLRREQTDRDRGPEVEATLRTLGRSFSAGPLGRFYVSGIKPDSIRFLEAGAGGEATILFAAEDMGLRFGDAFENPGDGPDLADGDEVCFFKPLPGGSPGRSGIVEGIPQCAGPEGLRSGEVTFQSGDFLDPAGEAMGIVPDGVAAVVAKFAHGTEREVPVHDNFFHFAWDAAEGAISEAEVEAGVPIGPAEIVWLDADGAAVSRPPSKTLEAIEDFLRNNK